jgi:hypothetical protein
MQIVLSILYGVRPLSSKELSRTIPEHSVNDQFAFRQTGSTTCALIYTMHHVTRMLESNSYVRCLLVDFSKAFDVIDHTILLSKLRDFNLPCNIYNWVVSFLNCREQFVSINGAVSDICRINKGVVQGSGLGPILFSLMVSDLKPISLINIMCKYADDTNLLSPENSDTSIEEEFSHICKWATDNKMILNCQKTKEIVFHRPNPRLLILPSKMVSIERVDSAKLLGITINGNLKFDDHVKTLLSCPNVVNAYFL